MVVVPDLKVSFCQSFDGKAVLQGDHINQHEIRGTVEGDLWLLRERRDDGRSQQQGQQNERIESP